MVKHFIVDLDIPREELERYYRGEARLVRARSHEGLWIQFRADVLRPFVTRRGIAGTFVVVVNDNHKLVEFARAGTHPIRTDG